MKIVDAFIFYNELDMLEYRLSILYDIVDHFILVESTRTFIGNEKPLFFENNKQRFQKYADKIIHIIDRDFMENPKHDYTKGWKDEVWYNENHQRNSIEDGLKQLELSDNDIIQVSDVDEIPDPNILLQIKNNNMKINYVSLCQDFYYYNLTYKNFSEKWDFAKIMSYKHYVDSFNRTPQYCREVEPKHVIKRGGWHLSYFGDTNFIRNKIKQFAHQEFNQDKYTNIENIEYSIKTGKDLFERPYEKCIKIPIYENDYLPPNYNYFDNLIIE
jgi:beta-1,4-mannosyl-glycoprotein beta-1,4-N-acetylglucosaminyltransferase